MGAEELKTLYLRWLLDVWGKGDVKVAEEVLAEDLIDHNPIEGQPHGRAGDIWAARSEGPFPICASQPTSSSPTVITSSDDGR